jgi:O-antigen/teichoic acid export membrane protein
VFTTDTVVLAWAVALPFPVTVLLLWPFIRRRARGRSRLDVGYGALTRNALRTTLAASATGLMVSGFPLLLAVTSPGEPDELLGLFILCITITRAPLIVVAMSLQSYLVVTFRDARSGFWRTLLRLEALVGAVGIVLAAAAWAAGPAVYSLLYPGRLAPDGGFLAVLVLSSALVGALCISGPAVLARSRHTAFLLGWVVAAGVTVACLLLPLDLATRTFAALLAGPAAGLLVHSLHLALHRSGDAPAAASSPVERRPA